MVVFLCIDYTIWPGWNHRGVYLYSREKDFKVGQRKFKFTFDSLLARIKFPGNYLTELTGG